MDKSIYKNTAGIFAVLFFVLLGIISGRGEDLKVEEIIAKHIDSIGTKDARAQVKNVVVIGASEFIIKVPYTKTPGKTVLSSDIGNILFASTFDTLDYPFDKIGFFGKKVNIPYIRPGARSPLGSYLLLNDKILSAGLFAGTILPSWRFLDPDAIGKEKIENGGKKKINGRDAYVVNYVPKGGFTADSSVKLYFDAENFRHVRTEYRQKIPNKEFYAIGVQGSQTGENINVLTEDFGDFKEEKGLMLPHSYNISLTVDGRAATNEYRWNVAINEYRFNQNLGTDFFKF